MLDLLQLTVDWFSEGRELRFAIVSQPPQTSDKPLKDDMAKGPDERPIVWAAAVNPRVAACAIRTPLALHTRPATMDQRIYVALRVGIRLASKRQARSAFS